MNSIGKGMPIMEMMDASPMTPNSGTPRSMKKTNEMTSSMDQSSLPWKWSVRLRMSRKSP